MFTGIIEEVGTVSEVSPGGLEIRAAAVLDGVRLGDSMAVSGACLTVTAIRTDGFSVDVVPETWRRTNLGDLHPGDPVNLERSLTPASRMGGHFVQGHVDGTGRIASVAPDGDAVMVHVEAPPEVLRYVVQKGFIAIDGVSLTVVGCGDRAFSITLIPFTRTHTAFRVRKAGDRVNLEVDILSKYVERFLSPEKRETPGAG